PALRFRALCRGSRHGIADRKPGAGSLPETPMSDTLAGLRRKIDSAATLESVVRTMKAMAASSIGQYEEAVRALADYERTVELGLSACLARLEPVPLETPGARLAPGIGAIVFGSDQGLVGRFNEALGEFVVASLAALP